MAGPSAYVHSNADTANLAVGIGILDNISGTGDFIETPYIQSTLNKLNFIANALDAAANDFLEGYSLDAAQDIADDAKEALAQLANRILYGKDAYEMANTLMRNQNVKSKDLINQLEGKGELAEVIKNYLMQNMHATIGELTSFIAKYLNEGKTTINVSEASAQIVELGKLFDVQSIKTTFRKKAEQDLTDNIFRSGKELITGRNGAYRNMIKDLIRTSQYGTVQKTGSAIHNFCQKLGKKMHELAGEKIPFMWSGDPNELEKQIDGFINKLEALLKSSLTPEKLLDISQTRGAIGEEVRESISRAANSVIISLQVGNLSEDKIVKEMTNVLQKEGASNTLSKMDSYKSSDKMSQTDLILLNNKTKKIARAQSKNHFASYFINNKTANSEIKNFRWKVEDAANLLNFITNLSASNAGFGVSLNDFDIRVVTEAIVNNIWHKNIDSYKSMGGTIEKIGGKSGADFKKELEGSLEKLLAGQVVNLLGVTLQVNTEKVSIDPGASNIFYVLNGRLKRTSDLVREAMKQIDDNQVKFLTTERNRLVNVTLSGMNLEGIETEHFLVNKLRSGHYISPKKYEADQGIGEAMGESIMNNIKVTVSLGTSIEVLNKTSMII